MLTTILVCEIQTGEVFTPLNQVPTVTIFCAFAYNTYLNISRYVYNCFIYIELNRVYGNRQTTEDKYNCPRNLSENLHMKQGFF